MIIKNEKKKKEEKIKGMQTARRHVRERGR